MAAHLSVAVLGTVALLLRFDRAVAPFSTMFGKASIAVGIGLLFWLLRLIARRR